MKILIALRYRRVLWGTAMTACLLASSILTIGSSAYAANPVPYVNEPLAPDAAAPGGPGFTLTVNGTGFVSSSVVKWNGSARVTHFVSQGQLTATILPTDIAKAGTASITVVNPGPGGGTSGVLFFPIATPTSSVPLARTDFDSAGGNIQVVTADFNGDGKLDLATAEYYDSTVRIFLGKGDGTFSIGPTYPACHAGGLATGDFNGDGIGDLAVADDGCGQVTILLGNGDGTFREGGNFETGGSGIFAPYSVAVGDFNGDGKLDLAAANELMNSVSVLLGNGDGTFQSHVDYATVPDCRQVATGDFNGDGRLDLVVSSGSDNAVSVLLGNGNGTFQPQSQYQHDGTDNPYLILADLNRDGKLDVAVANNGGGVPVLLGNGDGTFHSGVRYATGGFSASVTAADFNGDGILDLVTSNYFSSNISLLLGNGDGTFEAHVDYPAGDGARGIAAGDFNGDGRLDLAVGNQFVDSISIFLQSYAPLLLLTPSSLTFAPQAVGTTSAAKQARLSNNGTQSLTLSSVVASGDFAQTDDCPATVAPAGFCTLSVTFKPSVAGIRTGAVTITDNAAGSPHKLLLTGTGGIPMASLNPASLTFAAQTVGTTSPAKPATLKNTGSGPLSITSITTACDFAQTNNCGSKVNPGASCTLNITFKPKAAGTSASCKVTVWFTPTSAGTRSGTVTICDNAPGSPHKLALSGAATGTGSISLTLSPASLSFGSLVVGASSSPQTVTLTNTGTVAAKFLCPFGFFAIQGTNWLAFHEQSNCGSSLAPKVSCQVSVFFKPLASGTKTGYFTVRQGAASVQIPLNGTGTP